MVGEGHGGEGWVLQCMCVHAGNTEGHDIIKDSDEDKGIEVEKMGMTYGNATITLAASYARILSDGSSRLAWNIHRHLPAPCPCVFFDQSQTSTVTLVMKIKQGSPFSDTGSSNPDSL